MRKEKKKRGGEGRVGSGRPHSEATLARERRKGKEGWDGKDHHVDSALDAVSLSKRKNSACVYVVSWTLKEAECKQVKPSIVSSKQSNFWNQFFAGISIFAIEVKAQQDGSSMIRNGCDPAGIKYQGRVSTR